MVSSSTGRESRTPASSLEDWRAAITLHLCVVVVVGRTQRSAVPARSLPELRRIRSLFRPTAEVTGFEPATDLPQLFSKQSPHHSDHFRLCLSPNRIPVVQPQSASLPESRYSGTLCSGSRNRTCDWTGNNRLPVPTQAPPECNAACAASLINGDVRNRTAHPTKARGLQPRSDPTLKHRRRGSGVFFGEHRGVFISYRTKKTPDPFPRAADQN